MTVTYGSSAYCTTCLAVVNCDVKQDAGCITFVCANCGKVCDQDFEEER